MGSSLALGWMCCLSACPTDTFEELFEAFHALKDQVSLRLLDYILFSYGCKHPVNWQFLSVGLEGFLLIDGFFSLSEIMYPLSRSLFTFSWEFVLYLCFFKKNWGLLGAGHGKLQLLWRCGHCCQKQDVSHPRTAVSLSPEQDNLVTMSLIFPLY